MTTTTALPHPRTMWRAFREKDAAYEGTFLVAVKTTGIFCRPTCRAKPPRAENVEFFASAEEAARNGYRACKLCRPTEAAPTPAIVQRLTELVEASPERVLRDAELRAMGVAPATARRQFRAHRGMTFAAYQRAHRLGAALREVREGSAVVEAQLAAGFESGSGFREAIGKLFGAPPSDAAGVVVLSARWIDTPLGAMLGIANDEGLLLLDFHDRKGLPTAIARLRTRMGSRGGRGQPARPAVIVPGAGRHPHLERIERELRAYFAGGLDAFTVSVAPQGSVFERRAWEYLRTIPPGVTRSYGEQARALGVPGASRAVGRANGMNYLSLIIPCHRVVGAGGALTGYGGGLARKRWLLEHERGRHGAGLFAGDAAEPRR